MNFSYFIFLCLAFSPAVIDGQQIVTQTRTLPAFTKIRTSKNIVTNLISGPEENITVSARQDMQQHIITALDPQDSSTLVIDIVIPGAQGDVEVGLITVDIRTRFKQVEAVTVVGSGKFEVMTNDLMEGVPAVEFTLSGSGRIITQRVITEKITVSITGSGYVYTQGNHEMPNVDLRISGSGSIRGENMYATDAKVHLTGSGDMFLRPRRSLTGSLTGSGTIHYVSSIPSDFGPELPTVTGSGKLVNNVDVPSNHPSNTPYRAGTIVHFGGSGGTKLTTAVFSVFASVLLMLALN